MGVITMYSTGEIVTGRWVHPSNEKKDVDKLQGVLQHGAWRRVV